MSKPKLLIPPINVDFDKSIASEINAILEALEFPLSELPSKDALMRDGIPLKKQTNNSQVVSVFQTKQNADGAANVHAAAQAAALGLTPPTAASPAAPDAHGAGDSTNKQRHLSHVYKFIDLHRLQLCMWNFVNEITLMVRAKQQQARHVMPLDAIGLNPRGMELALRMPTMLSLKQAMHQQKTLLGGAAFAACLRQGLEGLLWLQRMEYVHGDIHGGNIFFKTENGFLVLVLGDLGSARPYTLFGDNESDFNGFTETVHPVMMYNPNDRQKMRTCSIEYDIFAWANAMGTELFNRPLYSMARAAEGLDMYCFELKLKKIVTEDIIQTLQPRIETSIKDPVVIDVLRSMLREWEQRPDAEEALTALGGSGLTPIQSLAQD